MRNTSSKMIYILSIHSGLGTGGAESLMANSILPNVNRSRYIIDFVTHSKEQELWENQIRELGSHIYRVDRLGIKSLFTYKRQWEVFFKEHSYYQVIHIHFYNMVPIIAPIARKYGMRIIVHSHSTPITTFSTKAYLKKFYKLLIGNHSDVRVSCSNKAGTYLFGKNKKFIVLNNSISLNNYIFSTEVRDQKRQELGIPTGKYVIGTVGRIAHPKNPELIVSIIKQLTERNRNFYFLWIGKGNWALYKRKLEALGVLNYVIHLENRTDIPQLLSALDLFIFPSFWEGFGTAGIEAQANGLTCLYSEQIPTESILVSEKVKRLPIKLGAEVWVNEIIKQMDYPMIRETNLINNLQNYDSKKTAKLLCNIYDNLILKK